MRYSIQRIFGTPGNHGESQRDTEEYHGRTRADSCGKAAGAGSRDPVTPQEWESSNGVVREAWHQRKDLLLLGAELPCGSNESPDIHGAKHSGKQSQSRSPFGQGNRFNRSHIRDRQQPEVLLLLRSIRVSFRSIDLIRPSEDRFLTPFGFVKLSTGETAPSRGGRPGW